ncbi:MAG: hypothetical protein RLZZ488_2754 [Pseudomonadota bacterium]|jgi:uncharacterized RDD family membrane protein YckC
MPDDKSSGKISLVEQRMAAARSRTAAEVQHAKTQPAVSERANSGLLKFQFEQDFSVYSKAGLQERLFALAIDLSICTPIALLIKSATAYFTNNMFVNLGASASFAPVIFFYWVFLTWQSGMTFGKRVLGLQVVHASFPNSRLGLVRVIVRESVGRILCLFPLTLLFGVYPTDLISGTRVVRIRNQDIRV